MKHCDIKYLFGIFEIILNKEKEKNQKLYNGDFSYYRTSVGIFTEFFLSHAEIVTDDLFNFFINNIDCEELSKYFISGYRKLLEKEKSVASSKIVCENSKKFQTPIIERTNEKIKNSQSIKNFIDFNCNEAKLYDNINYYNKIYIELNNKDGYDFINENYPIFCLSAACYEIFEKKKCDESKFEDCIDEIVNTYETAKINILSEDKQLIKYQLLSLNSNTTIHNSKESRTIYDSRVESYFWISVPRFLLKCFEECITKKFIHEISFRISGITKVLPAYEELEVGRVFSLDIQSLPHISKLYDISDYNNGLWITHDIEDKSLTFEELCSDFELQDNNIVTQVIHIVYSCLDNECYIIHLDHEYIFYSIDEYEKRQQNHAQKGESKKRIKTFKIDNASIPFSYEFEGKYTLLICLDAFFNNKNLVKEYFEKQS